jgi:hypothetical protein
VYRYIGLELSRVHDETSKHGGLRVYVLGVDVVCDARGIPQGTAGYSNPRIRKGDEVIKVQDLPVGSMAPGELLSILSGEPDSTVDVTFRAGAGEGGADEDVIGDRRVYTCKLLRHTCALPSAANGGQKKGGGDFFSASWIGLLGGQVDKFALSSDSVRQAFKAVQAELVREQRSHTDSRQVLEEITAKFEQLSIAYAELRRLATEAVNDPASVVGRLQARWNQEREELEGRCEALKSEMAALPQMIDRREIEWARSSQEAAENRLQALIADFESQRAADVLARQQLDAQSAGIIKALQRTLESTEKDHAETLKARDAAISQLVNFAEAHRALEEDHSNLRTRSQCLQVQKAKLEAEISAMAAEDGLAIAELTEKVIQLRSSLEANIAQSVKTELENQRLSLEVDSLQRALGVSETAAARAATQVARSCAFMFASFDRTRLQDVWVELVFKCRSPAEKAVARAGAQTAKLELAVSELRQELESGQDELHHLDVENEQIKNECLQHEMQACLPTHARTHASTRTCTHTRKHAHMHTHTRMHIHIQITKSRRKGVRNSSCTYKACWRINKVRQSERSSS